MTQDNIQQMENIALTTKMSEHHVRVAVVGNVDAGKSTLIGTLKTGQLDNARGSARAKIMMHKHEIETGRTSTVTSHLLGFDEDSNPVVCNGEGSGKAGAKKDAMADVAARSQSLVTLVDLAGHEKYLKTTVHGISSGMIDYALVLVNARQPPTHMTRHHINLAAACSIPFVVVLTKTDGCPAHIIKSTKDEVNKILRSPEIKKKSYEIKKEFDVTIVKDKMHAITPVVSISCVTGDGIDLLNKLLSSLPKRRRHQQKIGRLFEYLVEDTFNVTGVGMVVSGFVNAGRVEVGQKVFVGPVNGSFIATQVKSAHIARTHVKSVVAGNNACLALALGKEEKKLIRKGMVVLEHEVDTSFVFEAEVAILKGSGVDGTTIKKDYETMVHILHMKQCARIESVEVMEGSNGYSTVDAFGEPIIRPGCRAKIVFRFMQRKEFVRTGMRVLFRDGHLRGCGVIIRVGEADA